MNGQDKYSSRMTKRKNKKVNKVYNILITVVVLLIIVVGATIFLGNNDEPASQKTNSNPDSNQTASNIDEESDKQDDDSNKDESSTETEQAQEEDENVEEGQDSDQESSESEEDTTESEKVEEEASDGNVEEAYSDPSWKPVGTEQSGEHVTQFEQGSADWNEMERAVAYGAGIDQNNMTLWYLQNGGAPNKAIGTVSPKDGSSTYRVYIEWVDGEGWKPTKVEKLIQNDKEG